METYNNFTIFEVNTDYIDRYNPTEDTKLLVNTVKDTFIFTENMQLFKTVNTNNVFIKTNCKYDSFEIFKINIIYDSKGYVIYTVIPYVYTSKSFENYLSNISYFKTVKYYTITGVSVKIVDVDFDVNKSVITIYGENGKILYSIMLNKTDNVIKTMDEMSELIKLIWNVVKQYR